MKGFQQGQSTSGLFSTFPRKDVAMRQWMMFVVAVLVVLLSLPASADAGAGRIRISSWLDGVVEWWASVWTVPKIDVRCTVDPWGGDCELQSAAARPSDEVDERCTVDPWGCPRGG